MGTSAAEAAQRAITGADIIGVNCGAALRLEDYVELAKQLFAAVGKTSVIVQPNAGSPRTKNERTIYDATSEEMATTASKLLAAGVHIIGG